MLENESFRHAAQAVQDEIAAMPTPAETPAETAEAVERVHDHDAEPVVSSARHGPTDRGAFSGLREGPTDARRR